MKTKQRVKASGEDEWEGGEKSMERERTTHTHTQTKVEARSGSPKIQRVERPTERKLPRKGEAHLAPDSGLLSDLE